MPRPGPPGTDVAAALGRDGPGDTAHARRVLRDMAALLALPAMWIDHSPADIIESLLGVLFGVLRLESAYARFDDPAGLAALERWRPGGPQAPAELEPILAGADARERGATIVSRAHPAGGELRVTSMASTLPGEGGLVIVASRRPDFPTNLELHLLRIALGQATISIHAARRLAGERAARVSAEQALRRRNEFLAALAQDLDQSLATLVERAAQARAFASEADHGSDIEPHASGRAQGAQGPAGGEGHAAPPARLTRREAEVLGLLAQGLSNREIAAVLWLSERTIERHITSLYRRIDVHRRSEATAYAMRHGLVSPDAREQ